MKRITKALVKLFRRTNIIGKVLFIILFLLAIAFTANFFVGFMNLRSTLFNALGLIGILLSITIYTSIAFEIVKSYFTNTDKN